MCGACTLEHIVHVKPAVTNKSPCNNLPQFEQNASFVIFYLLAIFG